MQRGISCKKRLCEVHAGEVEMMEGGGGGGEEIRRKRGRQGNERGSKRVFDLYLLSSGSPFVSSFFSNPSICILSFLICPAASPPSPHPPFPLCAHSPFPPSSKPGGLVSRCLISCLILLQHLFGCTHFCFFPPSNSRSVLYLQSLDNGTHWSRCHRGKIANHLISSRV